MLGIATGAFVDERDDWPRAVARVVDEGWAAVELTAIGEELFERLRDYLAEDPDLRSFERVSVHAPVVLRSTPAELARSIADWPVAYDVILHPDVYGGQEALQALGSRAVFENMDVQKSFGRSPGDLVEVFGRLPAAAFCLDVAHVWTNDTTMQLGFELLDAVGDRLRQVHLSGIEPDGTHRTTTEADLVRYEPLLERCRHVPWILEAELDDAARRAWR
jgi:hypothetical protein